MPHARFVRFAWLVLLVNVAVVAWGAFVRASGSGAGCGAHWPLCNGEVVPHSPRLETLIELGHRLSSGVALVLVVALLVGARRTFPKGHLARRGAGLSLLFIIGEALIGAVIVLLGKVAHDTSLTRAPSSALHLVNTFFLIGALTFTAWSASRDRSVRYARHAGIAWAFAATGVLVVLTGASGAIAALGDTLWPAVSLADGMRQDVAANAHVFLRLRALHPIFAVLAAVTSLATATVVSTLRPSRPVVRAATTVRVAVVLQVTAGFVNLLLLAPVAMQLVHVVLADAVVASLVILAASGLTDAQPAETYAPPRPSPFAGEGAGEGAR